MSLTELDAFPILNRVLLKRAHKRNVIYFMDKLDHISVTMTWEQQQQQPVEINYVQTFQEQL